jgi:hypothetical protein
VADRFHHLIESSDLEADVLLKVGRVTAPKAGRDDPGTLAGDGLLENPGLETAGAVGTVAAGAAGLRCCSCADRALALKVVFKLPNFCASLGAGLGTTLPAWDTGLADTPSGRTLVEMAAGRLLKEDTFATGFVGGPAAGIVAAGGGNGVDVGTVAMCMSAGRGRLLPLKGGATLLSWAAGSGTEGGGEAAMDLLVSFGTATAFAVGAS